jgi:hypothetical protein
MKRRSLSLIFGGLVVLAASSLGQAQLILDVKPDIAASYTSFNNNNQTFASSFQWNTNNPLTGFSAYLNSLIAGQSVLIGIVNDTSTGTSTTGAPTRAPTNSFIASGTVTVNGAGLYSVVLPSALTLTNGSFYWFVAQGTLNTTSSSFTTSPSQVVSNGASPAANTLFGVGPTQPLNSLVINTTLAGSTPANWVLQSSNQSLSYQLTTVPEPSTFVLGGVLVLAGGFVGWKRRRDAIRAKAVDRLVA